MRDDVITRVHGFLQRLSISAKQGEGPLNLKFGF